MEIRTKAGVLVADGYVRIVHGTRGDYLEFHPSQIFWLNLHKPKQCHRYFREYRTDDGVMVYLQSRTVSYADYRPGMVYIAPGDLSPSIK